MGACGAWACEARGGIVEGQARAGHGAHSAVKTGSRISSCVIGHRNSGISCAAPSLLPLLPLLPLAERVARAAVSSATVAASGAAAKGGGGV